MGRTLLGHVDGCARETYAPLTGGPTSSYQLQMLNADTMRLSAVSKGSLFSDESHPTFPAAP